MKTRIISGLIMLPLLLVVYFGGNVLLLACFIVGIIGVREFYNGFAAIDVRPSYAIAYASTFLLYAMALLDMDISWHMMWFFIVMLASLLYLFDIDKRKLEDGLATLTGIFYVVFFSYHVVLVDRTDEYSVLTWLIFLTAFGTDIMAYFSGYFFGKKKLCPKISPKKTISGSVGGMAGSIILCAIFGYFVCPDILLHCIIIGALGGAVSQFGDLTASIFKRKMGIKDYGDLIPGHGGILDRFDSVLFTAPLVYYYIAIVLM